MSRVKQIPDLSLVIPGSVKNSLLQVLKNIDSERDVFFYNYNSFIAAKNRIDLQTYLSFDTDAEKEDYLDRLSDLTRSRFAIVFNFLNHDYTALLNAMGYVADYVNS